MQFLELFYLFAWEANSLYCMMQAMRIITLNLFIDIAIIIDLTIKNLIIVSLWRIISTLDQFEKHYCLYKFIRMPYHLSHAKYSFEVTILQTTVKTWLVEISNNLEFPLQFFFIITYSCVYTLSYTRQNYSQFIFLTIFLVHNCKKYYDLF